MMKKLLAMGGKSWVYSLISLLNVGCGVLVTILIWHRYSASQESDILLLATSSISILAALSLVGVEQVLYFYADERKKSHAEAEYFFKLALTWALVSGLVFAGVVVGLSKYFLMLVASGFSESSQALARSILLCLSPQLVVAPALHVMRARWSLDEKFGRAYLLGSVNSLILLLCLILTALLRLESLEAFGRLSLAVFVAFILGFVFFHRHSVIRPRHSDWLKIKDLVIHSSMIKGANSVHNFLVQALISGLLSHMPTGAISIYQYAKRLADGVFAITAGPQVLIYHSRCARAVSHWNLKEMKANVRHFLKSFLGLFFAMALVVYGLAPTALAMVGKNFTPAILDQIRWVYTGIVLWYLIMGIETLAVGIILATRSSLVLFSVNFAFIFLFFVWSRVHNMESVLELVFTTAGFQSLSFCLFTLSALAIVRQRGVLGRGASAS